MAEKQTKKCGTTIKKCTCKSAYQDEKYGQGKRAHNLKADGEKGRCTVCGKEN